MIGAVISTAFAIGDAVVDYWSRRPDDLLVGVVIVAAVLLAAAASRHLQLNARRTRRFSVSAQEAEFVLSPHGEGAWTADVQARRAMSRPTAETLGRSPDSYA